ncbi:hypothetical protein ACFP1Z_29280 [Streptomyces gamaensis]|uniref:Uncharacterized protein n=1 Tax=Streptomyces gamaensis TaxID=1763542 RepID=A0ABW0Z6E1_9ACTN
MHIHETADHVSVHLTSCAPQDAATVIAALESVFAAPAAPPPRTPEHPTTPHPTPAPTVWCLTVDTAAPAAAAAEPAALSGPVVADLYGAAHPVQQVAQHLSGAFNARQQPTISGEHEIQVRLTLSPAPPVAD